MIYTSYMISYSSSKLRNAQNILRHKPAILARCFSKDVGACGDKGDGLSSTQQLGPVPGKRDRGCKSPVGCTPSTVKNFGYTSRAKDFGLFKISLGEFKGDFSRTVTKMGIPMAGLGLNRTSSCLQASARRGFSSDSGLPPHQEIGMPSLSPTMTEGNIARWLKKEGDKISPGEVLCEIETDKATVEMECMEEGYLAKILRGDGAKDIKVGEVIAVTVEEEDDVAKFKDYQASTSGAAGVEVASDSTPPKKEESQPVGSLASNASKGLPPHQEIGMPSLSPTMTEGNIARWLKKEGDKVSPGEVLCEVETDKATVEMECMEEGYLAKILHGDGAKDIKVGEVIAVTVEEEDDISKFKDYKASTSGAAGVEGASDSTPPKKEESQPVGSPSSKASKVDESPQAEDRIFMSPLARKLAEDHNVPLSSIKGTGPEGRIVKADVEDYLASSAKAVSTPVSKGTTTQTLDYSDVPVSQIRKVSASLLLLSKQTIPHYYLTVDTCVDKLVSLRSELNSLQEDSGRRQISIDDLVIKAAALALRKVPQCNSSWMNDYIRQYNNVNINVAIQTDNGPFAPVIRDADKKGLSKIAEEVDHWTQKAEDNSLKPEDYEGGTFTVVNLGGPFGIKQLCGIIIPPHAAILAIGSAERRVIPGVSPNQFNFGSFMSATLSCDHRVIDGAIGAEYLKAFKGYIENPHSMLI
ncbi:dihydrolipoyllysine-residue acetyltransferase component 3 of pyruvate dehydrogenase complex, mitochondrial-like isoform X2 [Magnolia sinica]|uniref:dihydrolipoyllysine-residue acetyltransferase component 3 of pyruvate dehydrogenase complex, mitochondrial-like isoform X2 n=1 Tax=Magnolia sinica TaxID=86752 RepID=UPI00265A5E36|nr:dihydrolipoyllysine-residue acetyltransferase component 3 of pyruvate dehydrogenase complex, mitochondrial-like isoform X2 [Magnolia sinica]